MTFPTLHHCHRSNEVVRLQLMLRELDFALEPDGFFGPMTREAVKTFQAQHGLPQTGRFGPDDWNELEQCFARHSSQFCTAISC